jgi:hypothetical protein
MQAAEEAPDPFEHLVAVELGRSSAALVVDGEAETLVGVERAARDVARRHGRHLGVGELANERMLLADLRVAPAAGTVELDDDRRAVVEHRLVDAVLVAPERDQAAVAANADGLEGIEDEVGRERRVGMR